MHMVSPQLIAQTDNWIAVNKPSGMLSIQDRHQHAIPSVKSWLEQRFGDIFIVHRIDKDTSGLLLFARHAEAHKFLNQLFENRQVQKTYLGMVHGVPVPPQGTINAAIAEHPAKNGTMVTHAKGKPAVTHYQLVQGFGKYSLVQFDIETGRTHQIRVHAQYMGHPIAADPLYSDGRGIYLSDFKRKMHLGKHTEEEKPLMGRLALHAHQLAFTDADGTAIGLEAPLHKDFKATLNQLEKNA
jgi:23S rRNA pseudouridine955/2504/2580 synthase/23S rRNA pseudouridine1911/1915/1917 synthase